MNVLFYAGGAVAIVATFLVVTRRNAVHALLYLILSLLSVALVFYALGAAFIALLEVIIYAGAIMVLFLFVVMTMKTSSPELQGRRRRWAAIDGQFSPQRGGAQHVRFSRSAGSFSAMAAHPLGVRRRS